MAVLVDGHGEMIWFVHEKGVLVDGHGEMIWFVHEKCVLVDGYDSLTKNAANLCQARR